MKIVFLGTNGWYDTKTGNTICILIDSHDGYIILDAGMGIHRLDDYMTVVKPAYLFLSHYHLDHIAGLHILGKFRFPEGLTIGVPDGTRNIFEKFVDSPFTIPLKDLPFNVRITELPGGQNEYPFFVESLPMRHSVTTLGFRFRLNEKIIAYCPDTGYCDNAVRLAKDADLLITECALKPGESNESWPHLNPETAARIAHESNAKKLALVHFDANTYREFSDRTRAETVARSIFPDAFAAHDNDIVEL